MRNLTGCFTFDVQARAFAAAPAMTRSVIAAAPRPASARIRGAVVNACAQDQGRCTTIAPRDIAAGAAAVNADATRLVVFPRDGRTAELWDLDVIQRLATIPLRTANCERHAEFLADALLLVEAVSCERGATQLGTLFDDRGNHLGAVGDRDFDLAGVQPMPAWSTMWTFLSKERVAIHDLTNGAMRGPFDLGANGSRWSRAWFTEVAGGQLVGVSLGITPGRVALIDASGVVEQFDPPTCSR